jgi:hypothetical protein
MRKMVPSCIFGCSCCSGSENKTSLVAAGPPGCAAAGVSSAPGPGGLCTARHGIRGRPCLETAHSDDLRLRPDLEGEGTGSQAEDGVKAVLERVGGGDNTTVPGPDEAGAEEISWELTRQLAAQIVSGQRKHRSIQRF